MKCKKINKKPCQIVTNDSRNIETAMPINCNGSLCIYIIILYRYYYYIQLSIIQYL